MTGHQQDWLDAAAAERLLDGTPSDAAFAGNGSSAGLAALLAAAAAVGKPSEELPGEDAAVAAFAAARERPAAAAWGYRRIQVPRVLSRPVKAALATAMAAAALGGVATAAGTGALQVPFVGPAGTRSAQPELSPSAVSPSTAAGGTETGTGTAAPGASAPPAGTSSPGDDEHAGHGENSSLIRLCRTYETSGGKDHKAPDRLAEVAGGAQDVATYCAERLRGNDGDQGPGTSEDGGDGGTGSGGTGRSPAATAHENVTEGTQSGKGQDRQGPGPPDSSADSGDSGDSSSSQAEHASGWSSSGGSGGSSESGSGSGG